MSQQRPHVSAAILSLRPIVTTAAIAVILCAAIQMLVFGFVHFTEVRWDKAERPVTAQSLTVVTGQAAAQRPPSQPAAVPTAQQATQAAQQPQPGAAPAPAQVQPAQPGQPQPIGRRARKITEVQAAAMQRIESQWAPVLEQFSTFAIVIGVVSTFALVAFANLGTVVAAGGSVPGVEKAVRATAWATLLALFAVPWQELLPSIPFPGVFGNYEEMVIGSEAVHAGKAAMVPLMASHLLLPLGTIVLAGLVVGNFRAGVERGVIVTSVSELDQALEREMEQIKQRGIGSNVGARTIGTLNRAIGEQTAPAAPAPPSQTVAPPPPMRPAAAPEADPAKGRSWVSPADRRMNQPSSGNPLRRLV
ncbi:MAG: hypothetical protein ACF8R7_16445 [Phycisphaerales bacterium JB039]